MARARFFFRDMPRKLKSPPWVLSEVLSSRTARFRVHAPPKPRIVREGGAWGLPCSCADCSHPMGTPWFMRTVFRVSDTGIQRAVALSARGGVPPYPCVTTSVGPRRAAHAPMPDARSTTATAIISRADRLGRSFSHRPFPALPRSGLRRRVVDHPAVTARRTRASRARARWRSGSPPSGTPNGYIVVVK